MFPDYIKAVTNDYHTKKGAKILSLLLAHPTPGNIKEACKVACNDRFSTKDYQILKTFFGEADDVKTCLSAIGKCDIDKFRPLQNFLKGKINDPDAKNVELLAWLIDFKERPYDYQKNYLVVNVQPVVTRVVHKTEEAKEEAVQLENGDREKVVATTALSTKSRSINKMIAAAVILAILAPVIYLSINPGTGRGKPHGVVLTGQESCMYWTGDHYQQISCSQKLAGTLIVALDSMKLNHFKKITQPDTITKNAIGYVWYAKINGSLELYTADGNHPVHQEYRLRPITLYMINKYIKSGAQSE